MNWRRPVRLAVGLAGVLAGGLAGFAQGAAPASGPEEKAATTADEKAVSIEVATKEFESVKAMRQFGTEAKPAAPRLSVPRLHTESAPAAPVPRLRSQLETTARGSNWLVEAMEKRAPTRGQRDPEERRLDQETSRRQETRPEEEAIKDLREREREEAANPFSRYLGQWMTPRDYVLLKPALGAGAKPGEAFGPPGSPAPPTVDDAPGPGLASKSVQPEWLTRTTPRTPGTPAPAVNPYLESLGGLGSPMTPAPVTAPKATPRAAAPAVISGPIVGPEPPAPTSRSKVPDFVRPNTDERYFKQLKRF